VRGARATWTWDAGRRRQERRRRDAFPVSEEVLVQQKKRDDGIRGVTCFGCVRACGLLLLRWFLQCRGTGKDHGRFEFSLYLDLTSPSLASPCMVTLLGELGLMLIGGLIEHFSSVCLNSVLTAGEEMAEDSRRREEQVREFELVRWEAHTVKKGWIVRFDGVDSLDEVCMPVLHTRGVACSLSIRCLKN
jgi:hypothetical protein